MPALCEVTLEMLAAIFCRFPVILDSHFGYYCHRDSTDARYQAAARVVL